MAAPKIVEEEAWKCLKHPSKFGRNGVCPVCLKDRLAILCPDCATVRPCACLAATSSSSSASSSFSRGEIGGEPDFRRSRSVGVPVLRPRDGLSASSRRNPAPQKCDRKTAWFRSLFKYSRKSESKEEKQSEVNFVSARCSGGGDGGGMVDLAVLRRSRSVSVEVTSGCGVGDFTKAKRWHFWSPVKAFRQSKVVQERSPLFRC